MKLETGFIPQTTQSTTLKGYRIAIKGQVAGFSIATPSENGRRNEIPSSGFTEYRDVVRQFLVPPLLRGSPVLPPNLSLSSFSISAAEIRGRSHLTAWSARSSGSCTPNGSVVHGSWIHSSPSVNATEVDSRLRKSYARRFCTWYSKLMKFRSC